MRPGEWRNKHPQLRKRIDLLIKSLREKIPRLEWLFVYQSPFARSTYSLVLLDTPLLLAVEVIVSTQDALSVKRVVTLRIKYPEVCIGYKPVFPKEETCLENVTSWVEEALSKAECRHYEKETPRVFLPIIIVSTISNAKRLDIPLIPSP